MNVHTPLSFSLMCLRFIPTFPVRWADTCSSFCFHPLTSGTFKIPFGTFWNPSSRGNLARISIRRFVARYGLSQSICRQTFCFVLKNVGQTGVQGHPGKWAYIQIPGVDHFVCQTLHSRKLHRFILHLLCLFSGIRSLRLTLKTFFFFQNPLSTSRFDHLRWNGEHIKAWTMPSLASSSASCWKRFSQPSSPRLDWLYDQMEQSLLATENSLSLTWLTPPCTVALS